MQRNGTRIAWMDYLRGFITLLVVAHHSSLAYTTFASFNPHAYILSTHPVVDTVRSRGLDIFEDFNDVFFMSLMFLISGIFVLSGLERKGVKVFIRDRFYRLFLPFLIGVTVLMLLAYFPAYYLAHHSYDLRAYVLDFFTVEDWPVGPPWFVWVLFLFNLILAVSYPLLHSLLKRLGNRLAILGKSPIKLLLIWLGITWLLYMPVVLWAGPDSWTGIGPFDFQISRLLLYFGYFVLGILIGCSGLGEGILAPGSTFMKRWPFWVVLCLLSYAALKFSEKPLTTMYNQHSLSPLQAALIYRSIWVLSCTASCIAFITLFQRLFRHGSRIWNSISANAYGIYLVHYIFVVWCQFVLLRVDLPAVEKFLITFMVSYLLSWGLIFLIRKIKVIGRYI